MKKIMAVIAAAAVALTLVGCANFGAKTSGTKWSKNFAIDATGEIKDADGTAADYARGFAALSASKKCSAIETTITLPKKDKKGNAVNIVKSSSGAFAVVGLAIDVHETEKAGKKYYDFVLVAVRPETGEFYVEKYENIAKDDLKESMNTSVSAIGGATKNAADGAAKWTSLDGKTSGSYVSGKKVKVENTDESWSWTITVTQDTKGTYIIKNGTTQLGTYTRALTDTEAAAKDPKAYGQVFMYGNAPKDTKLKATFKSNKDATVGLFADEDEE